jgi:hypothetical protein
MFCWDIVAVCRPVSTHHRLQYFLAGRFNSLPLVSPLGNLLYLMVVLINFTVNIGY